MRDRESVWPIMLQCMIGGKAESLEHALEAARWVVVEVAVFELVIATFRAISFF
jgi:hypothetical protein